MNEERTQTRARLLRALPKIELHVHLQGSVQPQTALELARKNGIELPPCESPQELYAYDTLDAFLAVYSILAEAIVETEDFHRITYEMLGSAAGNGARHVEFFASFCAHPKVPYGRQFDGIRAGMRDALRDYGITSAIIPGINREEGPEAAATYLDQILKYRDDDLIGVGLDYFEAPFPPEPFAPVYERARKAGLRLTAHAGEAGPASFVEASLDQLGVERIDHGYNIVDDAALLERCRDSGILFTCCPSTTTYTTPHKDLRAASHPIRRMNEAGLTLCLNSDDPPMFHTDLANEYLRAVEELGFSAADIERTIYNTIDHAWVDDSTRRTWRSEWQPLISEGIEALRQIDG
ncbi:MAG: adenosine deaminase [Pseudomonadota bacterium]